MRTEAGTCARSTASLSRPRCFWTAPRLSIADTEGNADAAFAISSSASAK